MPALLLGQWRSQVVRQRSAKPLFIGSIPIAASSPFIFRIENTRQLAAMIWFTARFHKIQHLQRPPVTMVRSKVPRLSDLSGLEKSCCLQINIVIESAALWIARINGVAWSSSISDRLSTLQNSRSGSASRNGRAVKRKVD